ncbi:MAG: hypothetical protein KGQ66_05755 [Acidobacteriota bacterium]|nr:hypothetical protein [Acidobacteriota bacterium]
MDEAPVDAELAAVRFALDQLNARRLLSEWTPRERVTYEHLQDRELALLTSLVH